MRIYTLAEYKLKKKEIIREIINGAVFVYPTDTIYGIGCNALDRDAVQKIRDIKNNQDRPFSVMVPSKGWIFENCDITEKEQEWINKLPGQYTIILNLRNKRGVARNVFMEDDTLGLRMPEHWCLEITRMARLPIITTSANVTGEDFMTSIDNLSSEIKKKIDFMIDAGEVRGRPSTLINLTMEEIGILER